MYEDNMMLCMINITKYTLGADKQINALFGNVIQRSSDAF
jgi:hypothetical protein